MIDVERIEAWLGWELPADQRSHFQRFALEPPLFATTAELLEANRYLRETYADADDDAIWADEYLAIGTNGCGDYHYIVRGFDRVIFYAGPDRLGEWNPVTNKPLYHSMAALIRHHRRLSALGPGISQEDMERLVSEAEKDVS